MKRTTILLVLAIALCSCHGRKDTTGVVDTVTDDYGRTIVVPAHPQRVVSLSPAVTEILFAIGADSLLAGRTDFCVYPDEAAQIPSIGGISNLNIEKILSLNPDLVISGSMVGKKVTDQMDQMGTPMVCVIEKPHFDALYDNIRTIGNLVGKTHEADSLCNKLMDETRALTNGDTGDTPSPQTDKSKENCQTVPTVYYVVGFGAGGNFTAGGNTFINDIIKMAGGRNIAEEVTGWNYSLEALVQNDPDFIIVRREDSAAFCSMKPYNRLRAVREGRVIGIVSGTLDLQVPRNIDAVLYIRKRMSELQK